MSSIYDDLQNNNTVDMTENTAFDKAAWSEKKQAEKQMAYDTIDKTATSLTLDGGNLQMYLDIQSRLDKYSVGNALLIMAQNPKATKLKDYDSWKESGGSVKAKQTGIVILEPAGEYVKDDGSTAVSYNTKRVFDITQTYTREKAKPQTSNDERLVLKALISNCVVPLKVVESLDTSTMGAFYDDKQKAVLVKKGLSNTDFFTSVAQELAHATLAKEGNYSRGQNGLKAYCTAYMLCKKYGIETTSFTFNELPSNFKNQDPPQVRETLTDIRNAMTEISDRMSKSFEQSKGTKQKDMER